MRNQDEEDAVSIIEEVMNDPETRGIVFASIGPNFDGVSMTLTDGNYQTHVSLAATVLHEQVSGVDVDVESYLKDVVKEFNGMDSQTENL